MSPRLALLLGLAVLRIFAASAAPAGASPPVDACELLRPSEIARVIGAAVEPGRRDDAGLGTNGVWSSSCVWTLQAEKDRPADPTAPLGGRSFVILNAMQWPLGSGRAHEFLDSFRKAAADGILPHALSTRRFGDEALWWGDGLAVCRQDVSFGLSVHLPRAPPAVQGAWEERLAPLVLNQIDRRNALLTRSTGH